MNITATYSTADLTSPLVFNAKTQNQRAGLAIANGNVYICFGSHNDIMPYTGWVMAYSESTLAQVAVYATTTIGSEGGIWMSGQAPPIDSAGNLYISTGNGSSGVTPNNLVQTGQSFIKLSPTLQLLDYFTPSNAATMSAGDMDLGSAGLLLLPNTSDVLGGGKQGVLYLVNTSNMGHFNASSDNVTQEFQAIYGQGTSHIHGAPVYFNSDLNGPTTYVWGENDVLRGFLFNATTGLLNTTPFATSTMTAPATNNDGAMPGGFLSISANGNSNGIHGPPPRLTAMLRATPTQHSQAMGWFRAFCMRSMRIRWLRCGAIRPMTRGMKLACSARLSRPRWLTARSMCPTLVRWARPMVPAPWWSTVCFRC